MGTERSICTGPKGDFQATAKPADTRKARLSLMQGMPDPFTHPCVLLTPAPDVPESRWPSVPKSLNSDVLMP